MPKYYLLREKEPWWNDKYIGVAFIQYADNKYVWFNQNNHIWNSSGNQDSIIAQYHYIEVSKEIFQKSFDIPILI